MSDGHDDGGDGSASAADESWLRDVAHVPAIELAETSVGKTIGRYRIERVLGKGGMGIVYLAHDDKLDRVVALKVLPSPSLGDGARRKRFLREARIAAGLNHPQIATIYDAGEVEERVVLAMEYVPGRTLRAMLEEQGGKLAIADVVRIGRAIALGLGRAHAAGVVHRDVKPDNVMIGESDAVKILDFGIAKLGASDVAGKAGDASTLETREGALVGTPAYMSPEQAKGAPVDARTDVFALGVTLYEMAAGKRPFDGATPLDVLIAIDRDQPPPLSTVRRDAPRWLEAIVVRCLAKDRRDRYESAQQVALALDAQTSPGAPRGARRVAFGVAVIGLIVAAVVGGRRFLVDDRARSIAEPAVTPTASLPVPKQSVAPTATTTTTTAATTTATTSATASASAPRPPRPSPSALARPTSSTSIPGPLDDPK